MNSSFPISKNPSQHNHHIQSVWNQRALKEEQRQQLKAHMQLAIENGLKMSISIGISILALYSTQQLLSFHNIQQQKIDEVNQEIDKIQPRVDKLEESFGTTFDPLLSKKVVQKNTYKVDPNLNPIVFIQQDK